MLDGVYDYINVIETTSLLGHKHNGKHEGEKYTYPSIDLEMSATATESKKVVGEKNKITFADKITIFVLCVASYCCYANFSILAPIFPLAAMEKDVSQMVVGLVIGIYNLVMFLSAPVIGSLVNTIGVKFLFVSGAAINATCAVLFGILKYGPPGNIYTILCLLTRGTQALGGAASQVAAYSIIAHKFPDRVSTLFTLMMTFASVGWMTGPPIGGTLYQFGGFYLPFCVTGATVALSGIFIWISLTPITDSQVGNTRSSIYYLTRPSTVILGFTMFTISFSTTFLEPTLSAYLTKEFGLETYQVGFMFLIVPATYSLTGPFLGIFCDKKGYFMTMLIVGPFLSGLAYMFLAPAPLFNIQPTLWMFVLASVVLGVFNNVAYVPLFPSLIITALEVGYEDNMATSGMVSGGLLAAYALGGAVGASVAGVMVETIGFRMSVFLVALVYIIDGIMLVVLAITKRKETHGGDVFDRKRTLAKRSLLKYENV